VDLTAENLGKKFGSFHAVKDFSFTFTEGICGLIGPNGSGKTTLMRMLADILKPTRGRALFNGTDIAVLDERYRDILGYLPQHFGMYRDFSAEKFLYYMAALKGLPVEQARKKIDELLGLVNLKEEKKKKIGAFSGGMKQRLGIAQALLNNPRVLILDEPTAGLDPNERIRFRNLIAQISGNRIVLLSTHIVSDVENIAAQVVLMKEGRILKSGSPDTLVKELEGKVWVITVPDSTLTDLRKGYKVGNMSRKNGNLEVKIISNEKPFPNALLAQPTLEELYLSCFELEEAERCFSL
jgi:ABC-type multidrug transport system ATPase subunit